LIGNTISHYKILGKLGEGGMGVVYKAEDTKLKRTIALKFLTPQSLGSKEEKARFIQEAQVAAALDHPNICTIHEIDEANGQTFIAMAYIEGLRLKDKIQSGPLKLDEALEIAIQVAEGLQGAHEKRIVHQDIKSANIMVTSKGQAKIMDFGLARLAGGMQVNNIGTIMGTVAYMSPEQARGEAVDYRTDIWSFGVVLYEMITGQLPFKSEYEQAVVYSILNEEPKSLKSIKSELPDELEAIVKKALAKDVNSRYQSAGDMLTDLRNVRTKLESVILRERRSIEKPQPSIAVLPFANLSADPEQEYFCDGMADEIINGLTHIESLRVVAQTSTFAFKGKHEDIREIGKKLNVETLLEGSVRKVGNRLRITAQLINVADGYHLWSEKYDRNVGEMCCPEDIFAIQDDISLAIVDILKVKLLGKEKATLQKHYTDNLEAYDLYLKGRYFWNKRTEESLKRSIQYFQQAIEKDPHYALAYSGLADSYITLQDYSSIPPAEVYPKAKEAALKALEIDDTLAEAHTSAAQVLFRHWDWESAESEYKKAIELNPNYPTAHHWYALLLMYMARFEEAIEEIERAQKLDTLSLVINRNLALVFFYARQYDRALDAVQKTLEIGPNFSMTHSTLGAIYLQKSMYEEALAEFQKERVLSDVWDHELENLIGITYAKMGERTKASKVLGDLIKRWEQEYASPFYIARVYFALEESDRGFKWLNKAHQERDSCLLEMKVDPIFDRVRSDPRFKALLKKVGLEK
jgi:serine/threonine protein kinase/Flp pilus assembly protein TadD